MIDFLKYKYLCFASSVIILLAGVSAYFIRGGFKYHIDFAGGTELRVAFEKPLPVAQLRSLLAQRGWEDPVIQNVGTSGTQFLIRVGESDSPVEQTFVDQMKEDLPENAMRVEHVEWVGAEVGRDIKWNALLSILLSFLVILMYVAIRSQYQYAVGAVVAIAHDMLAVLIYFLIFGEPMSLHVLAAVLAVLGYSLNDTLVIFSRVRENLRKMKGVAREEVVNISINQTLTRTMLTSITTFLAVGSIFMFGGQALRGFSLATMIGIVFGTYSSVYIASPVMLAISSSDQR